MTQPIFDEIMEGDWKEYQGLSSHHGPMCPKCCRDLDTEDCLSTGLGTCPTCHCPFTWRTIGFAGELLWTTWDVRPQV